MEELIYYLLFFAKWSSKPIAIYKPMILQKIVKMI